jgi:hypothetical protein
MASPDDICPRGEVPQRPIAWPSRLPPAVVRAPVGRRRFGGPARCSSPSSPKSVGVATQAHILEPVVKGELLDARRVLEPNTEVRCTPLQPNDITLQSPYLALERDDALPVRGRRGRLGFFFPGCASTSFWQGRKPASQSFSPARAPQEEERIERRRFARLPRPRRSSRSILTDRTQPESGERLRLALLSAARAVHRSDGPTPHQTLRPAIGVLRPKPRCRPLACAHPQSPQLWHRCLSRGRGRSEA